MAAQLVALCIDANDPGRVARFWTDLLGWGRTDEHGGITLVANDDTGFDLHVAPTEDTRTVRNRMHLDLTSTSAEDQQRLVATALRLGGRHVDIGQRPDEPHVVLADPEGNEFCVIEPGNGFLADCGFVGAVACDGSQEVGYFWSAALGWPLVWDRDQETAIRSPHGGPKVSWGGPPFGPKRGKNRLHFDLAPSDADQQAEVDNLVSLGATRVDIGQGDVAWVVMADPDGNEFCVLPPR